MKYRKRKLGFSLIEILVAFSITSVSLALIFQIYSKGTVAAVLGKDYAQAVAIAESRLDELGITLDLNSTHYNGTDFNKFHWMIDIRDYPSAGTETGNPALLLKVVEIKVHWNDAGKERSITLQSLKPSPLS